MSLELCGQAHAVGQAERDGLFIRPAYGYSCGVEKRHLAIALVLALALVGPARANGGRASNQPLVIVTEEGSEDAEDAAFFSSVRALAAEVGISVNTDEVPSFSVVRDVLLAKVRQESKPFLVSWIVRDGTSRKIHLFDPWKNRLRTRAVDAGASAEANGETLALILRAELLAYLNEPPAPSPQLPPPPPPRSPSPPSPAPRALPSWAAAASYVVGTFLREQGAVQGVRFSLDRRWSHLRLGAAYALLAGQDVNAAGTSLTLRRHPVELGLGYTVAVLSRLSFTAETALSGDWVSRHTSSADSPLRSQPDERRFLVGAGLRLRAELHLLRNLALHLAIGSEVPLNPHDFQIDRGAASTTVARLSPVRVVGEVGVTVLAF